MDNTEQRSRAKSGALSAIPAENLLIGVPKKGRLHEQCVKLLVEGAGLDYKRPDRVDIAHCKDVPVRSPPAPAPAPAPSPRATRCPACTPRGERPRSPHVAPDAHASGAAPCGEQVTLVFLPAHDIATYVSEGNVDMGITGSAAPVSSVGARRESERARTHAPARAQGSGCCLLRWNAELDLHLSCACAHVHVRERVRR
jgi:hypothetical protein